MTKDSEGNKHLAEERQQLKQVDIDETDRYGEEMLYSGVHRNNSEYEIKHVKKDTLNLNAAGFKPS